MSAASKFVSLPFEVTALQFSSTVAVQGIAQWLGVPIVRRHRRSGAVATLESIGFEVEGQSFTLYPGDWFVRGPNGWYQLEAESFAARYRPA
ncbi:hypothetical protein BS297_17735 [Rhodococcus erythropolis]|uniref:Uncharacterized protein n=1 Tax=Rhodococcus erythropolis TaxID=1833 RepID=A0A0C2ZYN2_RHOER|nr:hypothetical protein BS297_17735 [Rhodococcus erythropolis]KIM17560.1 hypothetical protein QV65_04235 [Rhodococcus erythropolis]